MLCDVYRQGIHSIPLEIQIRGDIEDNSEIIFLIYLGQHVVTPH